MFTGLPCSVVFQWGEWEASFPFTDLPAEGYTRADSGVAWEGEEIQVGR